MDAVLADGLPGILIGARSTGLTTAALLAQIHLRPTPGLPLMGSGWSPGPGVLRRTRDMLAPKTVSWLLGRTLPRLNAVVASYGQPPLHDVFELFDRCTKVLVMTSPSFDLVAPRPPVADLLDDPHYAAALAMSHTSLPRRPPRRLARLMKLKPWCEADRGGTCRAAGHPSDERSERGHRRRARAASSRSLRVMAASISARWVNACGKFPSCSPVSAISSEKRPRWLA
ncbi:hypothetical protein SAMN05216219_2469 [Mycetocola miduiensis]|uniref:Uncharacterized protein n=1 Tax=Mycetocola miduiensis TaxID=995034 RepID=A0A1I5CPN2_9MICO|nr:hypothetical protein SAMN05216219_2469 [Mycetocola miduiensis]